MNSLKIWFLSARPKTLSAAVAPVIIGTAMAWQAGAMHPPSVLAALFGAFCIQIGTNFCNDYADFQKGADTPERLGPARATQSGWVTPAAMLRATVFVFALGSLAGAYLVYRGGWLMLLIAVASLLAGVWYTAGPWALAYMGLGEPFALVFFGPIAVGGTYWVQAGDWPLSVTLAGWGPGLLACALLAVNNLRDIDQDRKAHKRTLAVRFGPRFARWEYGLCVTGALVGVPLFLGRVEPYNLSTMWLGSLILLAYNPMVTVWKGATGRALNDVLAQTGKLLFWYAFVFALVQWRISL